jgi:hypothetical protein
MQDGLVPVAMDRDETNGAEGPTRQMTPHQFRLPAAGHAPLACL